MRESKRNEAVIIAYECGYRVLEDGSVLSPSGLIRNTSVSTSGYLSFGISHCGVRYEVMVHKLAAFQKFGGLIFEEDREVRHKNNVRTDNSLDNITYGSHSENMMDLPAAVRYHMSRAGSEAQRKLSVKQVRRLRALREEGWSYAQLCEEFGLSISTVSYIINRKTYADV